MESTIATIDVFDYLMTLLPTEDILTYGDGQRRIRRLSLALDHAQPALEPLPLYQQLSTKTPGVLYESVDIARVYGRYSLAVVDAPILLEGKDETFHLRALNPRGQGILDLLSPADFPCSHDVRRVPDALYGTVPCEQRPVAEDERLQLNNISQVIRNLTHAFRSTDRF